MTEEAAKKRSWLPLIILGAAQFVMVLDSSVMNVSISQIVADLNTSIQGVQTAITMYTLVMAAFMLVGAKLGDMYGRDRIFAIGLAVYACGSLITAFSPNLAVLLFGWSLVEGLGAVMVIPAIAALIASNYVGKQRALAYGVIGGVAGAAIAAGPLIGGWVTTELSWRYVFVGEVVIIIGVLLFRRRMTPAPPAEHRPKLDVVGAALSALGLGLVVFGILMSSSWGWIQPTDPPTIGGHEVTPFGFSPVPFLIFGGLVFLALFKSWEDRRSEQGKDVLLSRGLAQIPPLGAGLETLGTMQLVLLGTFFVLPVYLQVVLGFNAFETGKRLFPMSVSMLVAALAGPATRESLCAEAGVPDRSRRDDACGARPDGNDRRDAERDDVRALAGPVRHRRRAAHVAGRQRDHVVGTAGERQRGRRPAGSGAEPRRVARHRTDRRDPAHVDDVELRLAHLGESGAAAGRQDEHHGAGREGDRHRLPSSRCEQAAVDAGLPTRIRRKRSRPTTGTRSSTG